METLPKADFYFKFLINFLIFIKSNRLIFLVSYTIYSHNTQRRYECKLLNDVQLVWMARRRPCNGPFFVGHQKWPLRKICMSDALCYVFYKSSILFKPCNGLSTCQLKAYLNYSFFPCCRSILEEIECAGTWTCSRKILLYFGHFGLVVKTIVSRNIY